MRRDEAVRPPYEDEHSRKRVGVLGQRPTDSRTFRRQIVERLVHMYPHWAASWTRPVFFAHMDLVQPPGSGGRREVSMRGSSPRMTGLA
jgi:hypothetical protein